MATNDRYSCWEVDEADYPSNKQLIERLRFLLRYAMLAPSSHNTEPWLFRVERDAISIHINRDRWLKVADDDQRELHISVGCALENLLIAGEHFGFSVQLNLMPASQDDSLVALAQFLEGGKPSPHRPPHLFEAITKRHTNHGRYESRPIDVAIIEQLQAMCVEEGVSLHLTGDEQIKREVDDLVVRGDVIEFADPAFRDELAYWIGQGVFGTNWLMSKMGRLALRHLNTGKSQAEKDSDLLMSAPVLGLISTDRDDRASQLRVGQVFERLSLHAASHGVWCQPMSQIVQLPELKRELADLIPQPGQTPQHPFRMGYAEPEKRRTPRRSLEEVLLP